MITSNLIKEINVRKKIKWIRIKIIINLWKRSYRKSTTTKNIDSQQNRENDDLVDTDIDLDTYTVVEDTTEIKKL